jgi:hypothetical protein
MKTAKTILRAMAFMTAITLVFAFKPVSTTEQYTTIGYSNVRYGWCQPYATFQSDCDPTETSGMSCHVVTSVGIVQARKFDCIRILYRDDD